MTVGITKPMSRRKRKYLLDTSSTLKSSAAMKTLYLIKKYFIQTKNTKYRKNLRVDNVLGGRIVAVGRLAEAVEVRVLLLLDGPPGGAVVVDDLLVLHDVLQREEGDVRRPLLAPHDAHREDVRRARVVDEARDVALVARVDAVVRAVLKFGVRGP